MISVQQYRAAIGAFYLVSSSVRFLFRQCVCGWWSWLRFISFLLLLCGDIHPNPGPNLNKPSHNLNIMHVNLNSLTVEPKLDELSTITLDYNIDILAISESWLTKDDCNDDIQIPNFLNPIRKDRCYSRGGGVCIYVRETLAYKRRVDLEHPGVESIWIEILTGRKKTAFCCLLQNH